MRVGLGVGPDTGTGTDINAGTVTPGGSTGPLPCCTSQQASDPTYSVTDDGNIRYNGQGKSCNPNCMDEFQFEQTVLNSMSGSGSTGKMIAIAAIVGVVVLVLAKR